MAKGITNMTEGPLAVQILKFSVPLMLSNVLQVLFNTSDIMVVGRFAGSIALGAVGSTTILVTLFTSFLIGIGNGVNVVVARFLGARSQKDVEETVHTSFILCAFFGLLVMAVGIGFARPILTLLDTKEELLERAILYLRIYFLGMPALALFNFGNAILSAAGDTRRPLAYLTIAGVVNVLLNLLLVIAFRLDVAGVAIASAIAQYISAGLVLLNLLRSREWYTLRFGKLRLDKHKTRAVLTLGLSNGFQNMIFAIANLFIQVGVNSFDTLMVQGNSAACNADALIYDVMAAVYVACASFMSQNYGAGNIQRVKKSYVISLAYSFAFGLGLSVILLIFGRQFLSLFTTEAAVVEAGLLRLRIMGFSYCVSSFMDCTIAASRGLGKSVAPTIIVIMGSCVFRVAWVYTVFAHFHTILSLYLVYICSWTLTGAAEILYFVRCYGEARQRLLCGKKVV